MLLGCRREKKTLWCLGSNSSHFAFHLLAFCAVLKDPRSPLFRTTARAYILFFPFFSLESSQIKMAVIQRQESLPLLWK